MGRKNGRGGGAKKIKKQQATSAQAPQVDDMSVMLEGNPSLEITALTVSDLKLSVLFKVAQDLDKVTTPNLLESALGNDEKLRYSFLALLMKYATLEKREWWFIFDDVLEVISGALRPSLSLSLSTTSNAVVIDNFLLHSQCVELSDAVKSAYKNPKAADKAFALGELQDGREGTNTSIYEKSEIRGDYIGWFDGVEEEGWAPSTLPRYMTKINTLVSELKRYLDHDNELPNVSSRSRAMITCYPGNGARYTKHVDNGGAVGNGRRLTALFYLNHEWAVGDGGELGIFKAGELKTCTKSVQPVANRLVLFWSDSRVPHEVLPSNKERYTITIWFFDSEEWANAKLKGVIPEKTSVEEESEASSGEDKFVSVREDAPDESREPSGE